MRCGVPFIFVSVSVLLTLADTAAAQPRPNIVFLLADDMGYADLGCFGSQAIQSPSLDRLASQGTRLTHCYAASPNCSPARVGILTGRSPYRVGMYDFARFKLRKGPDDLQTQRHRRWQDPWLDERACGG
ncbi:MAG: sulfatase-like hydrolase/transferase [Planctomycetota bacterium]